MRKIFSDRVLFTSNFQSEDVLSTHRKTNRTELLFSLLICFDKGTLNLIPICKIVGTFTFWRERVQRNSIWHENFRLWNCHAIITEKGWSRVIKETGIYLLCSVFARMLHNTENLISQQCFYYINNNMLLLMLFTM